MATVPVQSELFDSQLKCLICFNKFKTPRVLPCLHCFCEKCLADYIVLKVKNPSEQITCPVCLEKCDPPNRKLSIDKWASSFFLNDIIVSIQEIEEETEESSRLCDLCRSEGKEVDAEFWCSDCRDKLCSTCLRYHDKYMKRNKPLKPYKTVPIAKMDKKFILKYNKHCRPCERGHSVTMYCVDHQQMCCTLCCTTVHRQCKEVRDLNQTGKELSEGNMAANVLKDVGNITKNLQQFQDFRPTTESTFDSDIEKCIEDIDELCYDIKQQADIFQTNFRKAAKEIRENVKSKYRKNQEHLHCFSRNVDNSNQVFNVFNLHGDPKQKFIAYNTTISQLNSHYARLKTELKDEQDVRISPEVNKAILELKKMVTSFSKINTSSIPSASASNFIESMDGVLKIMASRTQLNSIVCAAQIAQPADPLSRGVTHIRSVTRRKVPGAKFTGGTSLSNGHVVMADWNNQRLVEFDTEHNIVGQYNVDGIPKGVTSLGGDDVYVSVGKRVSLGGPKSHPLYFRPNLLRPRCST